MCPVLVEPTEALEGGQGPVPQAAAVPGGLHPLEAQVAGVPQDLGGLGVVEGAGAADLPGVGAQLSQLHPAPWPT